MFNKVMKAVGLKSESKSSERRKAYRVHIHGLRAKVVGKPYDWALKDISATGAAIVCGKPFRPGTEFKIALFRGGRCLIPAIKVRVVRIGDNFVGCIFVDPDRRQSKLLHELVLEEQKKLADKKKNSGGAAPSKGCEPKEEGPKTLDLDSLG